MFGMFRRHTFVAVLLLAMLSQETWALAGTTGSLSGTFVEAGTTTPIADATISVTSPSQSLATKTDSTGHFSFVSLAPDTYTVTGEKQGYEPASQAGVSVFADQTQTLSLTGQKTLKEIAHVVSKSSANLVKPGTTADVYSVSATQQRAAAALGGGGGLNNAYSAIASVPGTFVPQGQSGWGQTIYIRGGDYTQVGYEFDGVPVQRAFDQYPTTNLSSLGQQELQVYTGAAPANAESSGLSGFVNQVIRTGTSPGFGEVDAGIGAPDYYHKLSFETGGASPNRNFSYYVGIAGYNQHFRYAGQDEGASLAPIYGAPYNIIAANCGSLQASAGCYSNNAGLFGAFPLGPNGYAIGPFTFGFASQAIDRENVVNLHFGIPHKHDSGKDDVQLLYDVSLVNNPSNTAFVDWAQSQTDIANGTASRNGTLYQPCGTTVQDCTLIGPNKPSYIDSQVYTGSTGTALTSANASAVSNYFFPGSPGQRAASATIDPLARDGEHYDQAIVKLQYQKNIGASAYFRAYGYTSYSDRLDYGPVSLVSSLVGPDSTDYELITHTRGFSGTFADQISPTHLINLAGSYTVASTVRDNNFFYAGAPPFGNGLAAVLVDSTHPTNGICYNASAGAPAAVACSGTPSGYYLQGVNGGPLQPGAGDPTIAAASGMTCGAGPCEYFVAESGNVGSFNTVTPKFTQASFQDTWRPDSRLLVNLGLRYNDFRYDLADTTGGLARALWVNSFNAWNCFSQTLGVFAAPTDPITGLPTACPAGSAQVAFSAKSQPINDYHEWQPRLGATFTVNPENVLRFSYGRYVQPADSAYQQYNRSEENIVSADPGNSNASGFYAFGFHQPSHQVFPEISYNTDFSWEHAIKGTSLSWKMTPYLRKTQAELATVLLDAKTNFVSGVNVGNETAYGLEFQFNAGDFARNGLAAQLSYTYTHATTRYDSLNGGATVVSGINNSILQYNAYTSACSGKQNTGGCGQTTNGQPAAPCYAAGVADPACSVAGTIANPYWNAPAQSLLDPKASYAPFDQFPTASVGTGVAGSYIVPHVIALVLNYKRDRWAITPSFQYTGGGKYGSPIQTPGIDPLNCGALPGTAANDPRYPYGPPAGFANAPAYDAQTCATPNGSLTIPNPFTKQFDGLGAFTQPNQIVGNLQITYDLSKNVTFAVTGVNLLSRCFGGTAAPWRIGGAACFYNEPALPYAGNFYNPGNAIQPAAAYPYGPVFGNVFQGITGGQSNPVQIFFTASIKI
ncbi:MAG TPA: TonB-dependent receptor [Candidatus Baltobacteraceae bacterium]|jgi:hypothetical protein